MNRPPLSAAATRTASSRAPPPRTTAHVHRVSDGLPVDDWQAVVGTDLGRVSTSMRRRTRARASRSTRCRPASTSTGSTRSSARPGCVAASWSDGGGPTGDGPVRTWNHPSSTRRRPRVARRGSGQGCRSARGRCRLRGRQFLRRASRGISKEMQGAAVGRARSRSSVAPETNVAGDSEEPPPPPHPATRTSPVFVSVGSRTTSATGARGGSCRAASGARSACPLLERSRWPSRWRRG